VDNLLSVDTTTLRNLGALGQEGLNLLFKVSDRVVITGDVYDEIVNGFQDPQAPTRVAFLEWYDANFNAQDQTSSKIIHLDAMLPGDYPGLSANRGKVKSEPCWIFGSEV